MKKSMLAGVVVFAAIAPIGCGKTSTTAEPAPSASAPAAAPSAQPTAAREAPTAGKVEHVTVQATGHGVSLSAAVDQAIQLAVEQVNGKSMDASSAQMQGGFAASIGERTLDISSTAFASYVETHSQGAVTNFKVVTQGTGAAKDTYDVTIEASVARFTKPATADRLRIALAPFRATASTFTVDTTHISADAVEQRLRDAITNSLTQSDRLSVLDREFSAETDSELELIASGKVSHEDFARLGQQLATDYLLVGRIDRFSYDRHERKLRTSDRTLVSLSGGATLALRLVNVATSQIEQAETVSVTLPDTEPTTLGTAVDAPRVVADLSAGLADQAARKVIGHLFPVTVLSLDGDDVVLSQGGQALVEGRRYEIVARGKEMKDPQTGQSLGRVEKACCVVVVNKVTPQLSYGSLVRKEIDVASAFAPGALELRGEVAGAPKAALNESAPAVAQAAPKRSVSPTVEAKQAEKPPPAEKDSNW